ncbi:hypothetical protein BC828DRAFT_380280 [Blastocladiella britannica]|nr:hypothetical protein BC828DRAFT_380280 [Blastocladiella britannica]
MFPLNNNTQSNSTSASSLRSSPATSTNSLGSRSSLGSAPTPRRQSSASTPPHRSSLKDVASASAPQSQTSSRRASSATSSQQQLGIFGSGDNLIAEMPSPSNHGMQAIPASLSMALRLQQQQPGRSGPTQNTLGLEEQYGKSRRLTAESLAAIPAAVARLSISGSRSGIHVEEFDYPTMRRSSESQERITRNMQRWRKSARIICATFRVFALFDRSAIAVNAGAKERGRTAPTTTPTGLGKIATGATVRALATKSTSAAAEDDPSSPSLGGGGDPLGLQMNSALNPLLADSFSDAGPSLAAAEGSSAQFRIVLSDFAANRAVFSMTPTLRAIFTSIPREKRQQADLHRIAAYLRNFQFFSKLTNQAVGGYAARIEYSYVQTGRVVIKQGHNPVSIYMIVRGACDVFRLDTLPDGRHVRRILRLLSAGDIFGDYGVINGTKRTAWVVTTTNCELLRIDKVDYDRLTVQSSGLVERYLSTMANVLRVPAADLAPLAPTITVRELKRGEILLQQGSAADRVYLVRRGTISCVRYIETWQQRVDTISAAVPLDGVHAPNISQRRPGTSRDALATPKYMVWHRRDDNREAYDRSRGDKVKGQMLTIGDRRVGDFFEEHTINMKAFTPGRRPKSVASGSSGGGNASAAASAVSLWNLSASISASRPSGIGDASRRVLDALLQFKAEYTYIANEDSEVLEFPNAEFLKLAPNDLLHYMQSALNVRPSVDTQVLMYLKMRAFVKVREKVVSEVLDRKKRENDRKFFM